MLLVTAGSKIQSCSKHLPNIPRADTNSIKLFIFLHVVCIVIAMQLPVLTTANSVHHELIGMSRAKTLSNGGEQAKYTSFRALYDAMKLVYVTR